MNSYGLVFGGEKTSHDSGNDITYNVVSGNDYTQVVIEGDEYILPKEAMQSDKVYDFVDKLPIEMLDEIKRSTNVFVQFPTLRQGDMVVCKNSVRNDDLHTISGTAKEIANYLQGLSACRMYAKGGYVEGGEVEDENEDSNIRFLTPMPPSKLNKTGIDSLAEIIGKDELREVMSGALYAGNKRIVATDAHILVVLENQNYPNSLKGTIKSLWNKVPQERLVGVNYPNWEVVIPQTEQYQTAELSIDDVLAYAYGGVLQGKKIIDEKDYDKYGKQKFRYALRINIGNLEIFVDSLLLTRILRVFKANDVRRIVFHIGNSNLRPIKITTDKGHYGLVMPINGEGEYIFLSQKIFYPISQKDFRRMTETYANYLKEFAKMLQADIPEMAEGGEITMNMPLLIRVLELAKEDVKEDKEIHFIAERLQSIADKGTLTMEDYDYISGLESNEKIQKLIAENDSNDSDLRFEQGGEIEDLISRGIVELKMYDTTPKHAKEYGFQCLNPLFIQTICVSESKRLKGLGTKVLSYIEKYAIENGHDLIFGHITQKAKFTKDKRETFFCDIDMIKNWLHSNGYAINNENNDFYKVIQSNKLEGGGSVLLAPNGKPSNLTPEQWHLVRTPEFKAWFGDWEALENAKMRDRGMDEITLNQLAKNVSKVVDKNGEPLILYRGNEWQMGKYGFKFKLGLNLLNKPNPQNFGFFFTDDLEVAKKYRKVDFYDSFIEGSITTIFLNANKVLDITDFGHKIGQINFVEGLVEKGIKFDLFEDLLTKIITFFEQGGEYKGWGNNTFDYFDVFPELRDLFLANGYKAIIFQEISRSYFPYKVFVAFESNQIKLADGTNTTFDGNNPDIRFESGGSVLLAPNGKPSNLTPEQWHLVRTPEFKAWFGDWEKINGYNFAQKNNGSRVIEFNGLNDYKKDATYEPLVVYHTTYRDFNEFSLNAPRANDLGYYGKGFYFGLDPLYLQKLYGGKAKPYFLNIQSPFIIDEFTPREFAEFFGVFVEDTITEENSEDLRNKLIKEGYDGIIVTNGIWGKEIVAFYPNQIKLADGSNTTFDGNNPDIRFESGGEIDRSLARKKQEISFDDFHIATFANFKKIRQVDLPKREPDFVSKSGSKYWYEGDKVYRMSNHWGRIIASCNWLLDGFAVRGLSQGYCKLKDFHREMSFLLNDKNVGKRFLVGKTSFLRSGKGAIDISENEGVFIKETSDFYVFDTFKVSKITLAYVKPLQKVNYE